MTGIIPGSTRFVRLEQLFHEALTVPPSSRSAFVAAACAGDHVLQQALLEMLAYAETDETGLRASVGSVAETLSAPRDRSGERIGPYLLAARIRFGGMAEVYAAERADGQFAQQVAIKIVRSDRPLAGMAALFQIERELLARLNHPHICQFFDGGSTEAGEPYFVMERLAGTALTKACVAQSLPWRVVTTHVLNLFSAVAHIHAQLIVHRDIKPDNVLIAETPTGPVVKLLDFGIAGAISDHTEPASSPSQNWHSAHYAAPEVVAGQAAGVGADIYSLGRLLADLLPLYPADRREEVALIAAHATANSPTQRYLSVEALAADLRAMRDRMPLSIRPRQPLYLAWRFAQRHALALAMASIVSVLVALALVREMSLRQTAEAATELAVQERDKAEAMRDFLLQAYEAASPEINQGRDLPVSELLDQQVASLQRTDADLAPNLRMDLLATLGRTLMNLGRYERADEALAKATSLAEETGQTGAITWAEIVVARGQNAQRQDQFEQAEQWFQAVEQASAWRQSGNDAHDLASNLYSSWAVVAQRTHRLDEAEALIRRALDAKRAFKTQNGQGVYTAQLLLTLGAIQSARGDHAGALSTFQTAHAENLAQDRAQSFPHLALLGWLGITLDQLNQPAQAEPYLREAVDVAEQLFPKAHPKLAGAYGNLGTMYLVNGRYAEAGPLLRQSLAVLKELGDQQSAIYQSRISNLGRLALEQEDLSAAAPLLTEALRLRQQTFGADSDRSALALLALSRLALLQGQSETALGHAEAAREIVQQLEASLAAPLWPDVQLTLAEAEASLQRATEARAHLAAFAASTAVKPNASEARNQALWQFQHARTLQSLGDTDAARSAYGDALDRFGGEARCQHPICAQIELRLAELAWQRGDRAEATARVAQARPVLEANMAPQSESLAKARTLISNAP